LVSTSTTLVVVRRTGPKEQERHTKRENIPQIVSEMFIIS